MSFTAGSLCSGYGGLSLAVENFFGAETKWFSEFEKAPSKILEQHWPGVPNHGDMTKIDWAAVEPVDIIEGGTPCQDLSAAGRRRGMTEGTRSNLWVQMREAVATIRPSLVIWENVRGAYSARAASAVESEPGLLGGFGDGRPALRALGRVLGDFSELGYDTEWVGVRASDAGAPHGRYRVFVIAHTDNDGRARLGRVEPIQRDTYGRGGTNRSGSLGEHAAHPAENANLAARGERGLAAPGEAEGGRSRADTGGRSGASAADSRSFRGDQGDSASGFGAEEADWAGVADERGPRSSGAEWGVYEPAIRRWERALGRVAPAATNADGKGGAHRLAPEFVEWMMGLPAGHVTGVPITRNEKLKALGNGVVPQQAELALSIAWSRIREGIT